MKEVIISSPVGMPNKEKYLSDALRQVDKRKIKAIKKQENGDIKVLVENSTQPMKYFIKTVKKTEDNHFDFISFLEEAKTVTKFGMLIKSLEYDTFFVLFFKK